MEFDARPLGFGLLVSLIGAFGLAHISSIDGNKYLGYALISMATIIFMAGAISLSAESTKKK